MITLYSLEPFAQVIAEDGIDELPLFEFANQEIWADMYGFKGFYLISTNGNIISNYHKVERRISVVWSKYHQTYVVTMMLNRKAFKRPLSRLLKMTFDPVPEMERKCVTFKNGNSRNVTLGNLIWKDCMGAKLTADDVRAIRAFPYAKYNMREIAARYGVTADTISDVLTCASWWWL